MRRAPRLARSLERLHPAGRRRPLREPRVEVAHVDEPVAATDFAPFAAPIVATHTAPQRPGIVQAHGGVIPHVVDGSTRNSSRHRSFFSGDHARTGRHCAVFGKRIPFTQVPHRFTAGFPFGIGRCSTFKVAPRLVSLLPKGRRARNPDGAGCPLPLFVEHKRLAVAFAGAACPWGRCAHLGDTPSGWAGPSSGPGPLGGCHG